MSMTGLDGVYEATRRAVDEWTQRLESRRGGIKTIVNKMLDENWRTIVLKAAGIENYHGDWRIDRWNGKTGFMQKQLESLVPEAVRMWFEENDVIEKLGPPSDEQRSALRKEFEKMQEVEIKAGLKERAQQVAEEVIKAIVETPQVTLELKRVEAQLADLNEQKRRLAGEVAVAEREKGNTE